ncbi:MAG: putative molybdenum carrier protein [Magnetococcales bacterium]|nr:putative molybdenum carrier protein [Magnetococcales bacterium]
MVMIKKIISGGQTGVDRAALDFGMDREIAVGGWCPKGRRSEDGVIPRRYPLEETIHLDYRYRTFLNVQDADGTLVLYQNQLRGGSALTSRHARKLGIPCMEVDLSQPHPIDEVIRWIQQHRIQIINIAGPRESENQGIHRRAGTFLCQLWDALERLALEKYTDNEYEFTTLNVTVRPPSSAGGGGRDD